MGEIYHGVRTKSGSLYLIRDTTHILGNPRWDIYHDGKWYFVFALVGPEFLTSNNIKDMKIMYNELFLAKGISSGQVIVASDIKNTKQFTNKMVFYKQGNAWGNTSSISETFQFK